MIEIKLPSGAAVSLLTEQMQKEFESRQRAGLLEEDVFMLNDLSFPDLLQLAEIAAFDIIMLLPIDILVEESNLPDIISKSIRALAPIYHYSEFRNYSESKALRLIQIIRNSLNKAENDDLFRNN